MNKTYDISIKKGYLNYQIVLIILMFLAGLLNVQDYIVYMGFYNFNSLLMITFYGLLVLVFFYIIINTLLKGNKMFSNTFLFWLLLVIAVILKFIILFIQSPYSFLPDRSNYLSIITFGGNLILMIVLSTGIKSIKWLKAIIISFGLGASLSAIIPFMFYPEMIGTRFTIINGYHFAGGFFNPAVISFISVGWLLIATSTLETSKVKKGLYFIVFILLIAASLAGLSRATLVSICLSLVVYLIMSNKFLKYLKTIIIVTILSILLFAFFKETVENFQDRLDGGVDFKEETRTVIWKDYIKSLPDYFLIGEVKGNYKKYTPTLRGPHNVYLNWFSEFGILAFVGFNILLLGILISINNVRRNISVQTSAALYAWLIGYLSIAMINETGYSNLMVFGAFGIVLAWGNIMKEKHT